MSEFNPKSLAILGRQPQLGIAELEAVYGPNHIRPLNGAALLDIAAGEINFKQLGGTVKIVQLLTKISSTKWPDIEKFLIKEVPKYLVSKEGKFTLGLSAYGLNANAREITRTGLAIKKAAKRPMRIIPNKEPSLNSAQVLHNKLTTQGAWELVLIRNDDATMVGQTFFIQDIEDYKSRDQARPYRDARIGMVPPKLAQILVNLAIGKYDSGLKKRHLGTKSLNKINVLDPFCGSGVVLQEALLMGYSVYGSDINPRMVEYSKLNLQWLVSNRPELGGRVVIENGDATNYQWSRFSVVASEAYLGRPLINVPSSNELDKIIYDVNTITKKFLRNIHGQIKSGRRAAIALPAWQIRPERFLHLPVIDELTDMGYAVLKFKHIGQDKLIYYRPGQIVAREIVVLEKN